ncbi:MAG: XrtA/PEP-CTERM system TPR-repeat protein PrsT [Rhodanobacteraceae bacterium]
MRSIKLNTRTVRNGLTLLCAMLVLGGCGLASGRGSLANGDKYQAEGKYRAAYIEAKKVLQRDNKNGDAWLLLGRASLMMGDPKDALGDFDNAKKNGVPAERLAVPMGRAMLVMHQYDDALKALSSEKSSDPKVEARVAVLRGNAYRGLKQPAQARQAYESALKLEPKEPRALVGLAELAAESDNPASAGSYVQQALSADPDNPQAWIAKGDLAFDSHDFAAAESAYQKALDLKHPDWLPQEHIYALARLANAQAQQNQYEKALATIQTLEKMSPQQPYAHYLKAVVLYKQGHLDDAVTELQQVLKVSPDNPQAQMLMGAVTYAQGNYGQAQMYLSNVMGMDPKNVATRKLLALTYYREGRSHQALDMLRPLVQGTPSDAELLAVLQKAAAEGAGMPGKQAAEPAAAKAPQGPFAQAGKALASGNDAEAIKLLQAMPAGNASTAAQRNSMLVMSYLREKQPDQAIKLAADYANKNPKDSAAHLLYGTTLVATGKRKEARAQYSEAYKLDPKNLAALLSLGSLDSMEGHYDAAATRYQTVLKQDPENAAAMTELGRLAMRKGDKTGAVKWFKQAIHAAPKSPTAYVGLVVLYSETGQFDEAVATAKQLVDADPNNAAALNALGAAELNAGHHKAALQPLQQAVNLAPKVALYRTNLARAQLLGKNTKDATRNLDEVIKADPTQTTAVALRAFLKLQDHDLPGAIALAQSLQKQPATKAAGYTLEGDLYMSNKSYGEAAKTYQQGLKVDYDRPLVVKSFEALSAGGAKDPQAVLQDWLAKHSDDGAVRLLLAQYYMGHSQNAQAAREYERILKKYPSNIDALNNLAWIYTGQHNPKALGLAERAYKLAKDSPGVADTYAWALIANNRPKAALPILEQAAKAAPKVPAIQYHLAVAQARTGDHAAARNTLAALQKSGADFEGKPAAEKLYKELGGAAGASADK